jgi:hypothetical protein
MAEFDLKPVNLQSGFIEKAASPELIGYDADRSLLAESRPVSPATS